MDRTHLRLRGGGIAAASQSAALSLSLLLFLIGASLGYHLLSASWAANSVYLPGGGASADESLLMILSTNLGTAAFLYSGVATVGLTSVVGIGMVAVFVGATMKVGVVVGGWGGLASDVGIYAPVEFLGFVLIGAAGIFPIAATALPGRGAEHLGLRVRYLNGVGGSLKFLGVGIGLVLAAAILEAGVIALR